MTEKEGKGILKELLLSDLMDTHDSQNRHFLVAMSINLTVTKNILQETSV